MDYMSFSLPQLKELAKSLKIPHYSTMRKPQLLAAIGEVLGPVPQTSKEQPADTQRKILEEKEQSAVQKETSEAQEQPADVQKGILKTQEQMADTQKEPLEPKASPAEAQKETDGTSEEPRQTARRFTSSRPVRKNAAAGSAARQGQVRTGRGPRFHGTKPAAQAPETPAAPAAVRPPVSVQGENDPVKPAYTENPQRAALPEEPAACAKTVKPVSDKVLEIIGDRAEEYAQEALDTTGRIGMTVERLYELASGEMADGILEVMPEGYGFIRCDNFLPGERDVYVSYQQIRRFNLKTGDAVRGGTRIRISIDDKSNKFAPLLFIESVNGFSTEAVRNRPDFEKLTPVYPNERIPLAVQGSPVSMRIMDLLSPIGKGQRGMIVAPPKAGKTTLLKQIAKAVTNTNPDMTLIVLLIDERPEEVTDIKEAIEQQGANAQVIYSTFDELPEHHKRVAEMVLGRAKRLVEHGKDVMILLDSITRLARAYNLTVMPSGRTLSGGLDPAALYAPKRFFGAARNMRQGGSLTILATALVETGSRMDDVVFEEFKGTGNMELVLNRKLSEKRVFPAIDIAKSGTRNENLLLTPQEQEAMDYIRKNLSGMKGEEAAEHVVDLFVHTRNNEDFIYTVKKTRLV